MSQAKFTPVADQGVLVEFDTEISAAASNAVAGLDRALAANPFSGLKETVPALVNLLVIFDPLVTDHEQAEAHVRLLLPTKPADTAQTQRHVIQVCYHDTLGPDLEAVADATGMSVQGVVDVHRGGDYQVQMYGFAPGYAYLGGIPEPIRIPRKPAAVRDIPAGSILIAHQQCIVTPMLMPTGWSVIGQTPTRVLRNDADKPFLFGLGDHVTFEQISRADFDRAIRREEADQEGRHEERQEAADG